jgi:hypothetical protein
MKRYPGKVNGVIGVRHQKRTDPVWVKMQRLRVGRPYKDTAGVLCRRVEVIDRQMVYELRREPDLRGGWDWVVCFAGRRILWRRSLRNALLACAAHADRTTARMVL